MNTYTKHSPEWELIRGNSGYWFSKSAMNFFGCRVYWHTLTEIDGGYLFITAEDNFDRTEKRFSVRFVNAADGYEIDTIGEFNAYETLDHAKTALKNISGFSQFLGKVGA